MSERLLHMLLPSHALGSVFARSSNESSILLLRSRSFFVQRPFVARKAFLLWRGTFSHVPGYFSDLWFGCSACSWSCLKRVWDYHGCCFAFCFFCLLYFEDVKVAIYDPHSLWARLLSLAQHGSGGGAFSRCAPKFPPCTAARPLIRHGAVWAGITGPVFLQPSSLTRLKCHSCTIARIYSSYGILSM